MNRRTIAIFRKTHGLKQAELAELIGVGKSTISAYERGYQPIPKWFKLRMEALIEEVGIDWSVEIPGDKSLMIGGGNRNPKTREPFIEEEQMEADLVMSDNRPDSEHYHAGNIDVWMFADENYELPERIGFHRINALKYIARFGKKQGFNQKDLDKAIAEIQKLKQLTTQEGIS